VGFSIMQRADGQQHLVFADEDVLTGPGAIDPQDAPKLIGQRSRILSISYGAFTDNEFRPEFEGRDGIEELKKMEEESTVKKTLNYIFSGLSSPEYFIDPASEDEEDLRAAAFAADQLGIDGVQSNKYGFQRLLQTYKNALKYGTSYCELALQLAGNQAVLDKLVPIHPLNVSQINYDAAGGPKSITVEGKVVGEKGKEFKRDIPIQKLVIFVNEDEGDLRGQSILRAAYFPYRIKREMLKLVNKGYERFLLGIPKISAPAGVDENHPSWAIAESLARRFAMNPRAGLVLPEGWEIDVLTATSSMPDALPYINMMDNAIAESMGMDWATISKGGNGSGGYGHSTNLMGASERVIRMYVDNFCAHVNTYLIPKLLIQNFPHLRRFPVLRYSTVGHVDASPKLNMLGMLINAAIKQGQGKPKDGEAKDSGSGNKKPGGGPAKFAEGGTEDAAGTQSAGGFDPQEFRLIVNELPKETREMLGFERDRRQALMAQYRQGQTTVYRKKDI